MPLSLSAQPWLQGSSMRGISCIPGKGWMGWESCCSLTPWPTQTRDILMPDSSCSSQGSERSFRMKFWCSCASHPCPGALLPSCSAQTLPHPTCCSPAPAQPFPWSFCLSQNPCSRAKAQESISCFTYNQSNKVELYIFSTSFITVLLHVSVPCSNSSVLV